MGFFRKKKKTAHATAVIRNSAGIHCRPTAEIIKGARQFSAEATITAPGIGSASTQSAIEIISLGLPQGQLVEIEVTGPDAEACAQCLKELFEKEFDFPDSVPSTEYTS